LRVLLLAFVSCGAPAVETHAYEAVVPAPPPRASAARDEIAPCPDETDEQCEAWLQIVRRSKATVVERVCFESWSSTLSAANQHVLDGVAHALIEHNDLHAALHGEPAASEVALQYLVSKGVDATRLQRESTQTGRCVDVRVTAQ
jgi:hypothetical protein